MLMQVGAKQRPVWRLAGLLQHGAPAPEPRLSHTAANLPGRPVDMWTIGGADRLRFHRFPSELGKRGNARLRPHTHRHYSSTKRLMLMIRKAEAFHQLLHRQ